MICKNSNILAYYINVLFYQNECLYFKVKFNGTSFIKYIAHLMTSFGQPQL